MKKLKNRERKPLTENFDAIKFSKRQTLRSQKSLKLKLRTGIGLTKGGTDRKYNITKKSYFHFPLWSQRADKHKTFIMNSIMNSMAQQLVQLEL